jgi:hypothetical protein
MLFTVHFTVTVAEPLQNEEFVFVTGNVEQLGQWNPNNAFRLVKTSDGYAYLANIKTNFIDIGPELFQPELTRSNFDTFSATIWSQKLASHRH